MQDEKPGEPPRADCRRHAGRPVHSPAMTETRPLQALCFIGISRGSCPRNYFRYPVAACRRIKKVGELNRAR